MLDGNSSDKKILSDKDYEDVNIENIKDMKKKIKSDIKYINKNSKKTIMSIDSLKEEIYENNEQNFKLKKELEEKKLNEIKIYKKIINILDQIDNVYKFADEFNNSKFTDKLSIIKKIIRKEIGEIEWIEIKSIVEFFNPEFHKCIGVEKDRTKEKDQIISVIENGYMLRGKVIRPASVIIAR